MRTMKTPSARPTALESQKGFTLIELSIVLVIIGLLVGGVIKGKDLIDNTKTTKLTQEYEIYANAYNAYVERYGSSPVADTRFGETTTASANGWINLRHAGLIALATGQTAATDTHPRNTFGGDVRILAQNILALSTNASDRTVCFFNVPAKAAAALDAKFDNGDATSGTIRAVTASTASPAADPGTSAPTTAAYSSDNYDICTLAR